MTIVFSSLILQKVLKHLNKLLKRFAKISVLIDKLLKLMTSFASPNIKIAATRMNVVRMGSSCLKVFYRIVVLQMLENSQEITRCKAYL